MERIKSTVLTFAGFIFALAVMGFFASVGLVVIGALCVVGTLAALIAAITALMTKRDPVTGLA
jgi:hypothetical protein